MCKEGHKRLPVIVVNPDEGAMATFAKLVGSGVQFFQAGFKTTSRDFVSSAKVSDASRLHPLPEARPESEFAISHTERYV
jgi:hypothetical protein